MENSGKRILVVDDGIINRKTIVKRLLSQNFSCDETEDAKATYKLLKNQQYDLVLLDLNLPDDSGLEILKNIRKEKSPIELPVIMVTADDTSESIVECLTSGANDYVAKPVNFKVLLTRIETQLRLKHIHKEFVKVKEMLAINSMVVTYNHEFNNPLAIAKMHLGRAKNTESTAAEVNASLEKIDVALTRISDLVKKIDGIATKQIEYSDYGFGIEMVKIK